MEDKTRERADSGSSQGTLDKPNKGPILTGQFLACILVMFADILGQHFVQPVLVPYGLSLGASLTVVGLFSTARFGAGVISMVWMPICADKFGKKPLLLISIVGSAAGYFVQGLAGMIGSPGDTQIAIMFAGRGIAGFFGGTQPVLTATVTAISLSQGSEMVRTRLTLLQASQNSFGVAIAPIAGALAMFGLHIPWLVAAIMTVLIFFLTIGIFTEPRTEKPLEDDTSSKEAAKKSGNPFCDKYLLMGMIAMFLTLTCVSGIMLGLPTLLALPEFGLQGDTEEQTSKNVANANGLTGLPFGMMNLLSSTILFLKLSRLIGEAKTVVLGVTLGATGLVLIGFTQAVYQVALCCGLKGIGVGLIMPAMQPAIAKWAVAKYPDKTAQANGLPMIGMVFGLMLGPLVMSSLLGDGTLESVRLTFWVCAGCLFSGQMVVVCILLGMARELGANKKQDDPAAKEMMKMAIETGAIPEQEFINEITDSVKQYMTSDSAKFRGYHVWHGIQQKYIRRMVDQTFASVPVLPRESWANADFHAPEFVEYITAAITHFWPVMEMQEKQQFHDKFPHIPLPDHTWQGVMRSFVPIQEGDLIVAQI